MEVLSCTLSSLPGRSWAREFEKQGIERMLTVDIIEPTLTKRESPIVLVPKKNGSPLFCSDYQNLNAVPIQDLYPIPGLDKCIESLDNATIFTNLDAKSG